MVGIRASYRTGLFARPQHGLLDAGAVGFGIWKHWNRNQYYCDYSLHALPGHEAQSHAFAGMAQPGDGRNGSTRGFAADRGTVHAAYRSIFRRPFLRHAGRRLGHVVDALLLDIWTSGSVRPDYSLLRFHVVNHSGVFTETDFRISGHGRGHCLLRLCESDRVGAL